MEGGDYSRNSLVATKPKRILVYANHIHALILTPIRAK
jgi:hypothetical protein